MLQQILNDKYIDPDVLDTLNEEQKKTLSEDVTGAGQTLEGVGGEAGQGVLQTQTKN